MTKCSDFINNVKVPKPKDKQRSIYLCQTGNNLTKLVIGVSETWRMNTVNY